MRSAWNTRRTVSSVAPGGQAHGRAVLPHGGAGAGPPGIATSADICAQSANGRDVGAVLARISELHEELARACRELASNSQNCLAAVPETRELCEPVIKRELLTIDDVAKLVRTGARTIRRWRREGKLPPALHFGGLVRWRKSDVERWIEERLE